MVTPFGVATVVVAAAVAPAVVTTIIVAIEAITAVIEASVLVASAIMVIAGARRGGRAKAGNDQPGGREHA